MTFVDVTDQDAVWVLETLGNVYGIVGQELSQVFAGADQLQANVEMRLLTHQVLDKVEGNKPGAPADYKHPELHAYEVDCLRRRADRDEKTDFFKLVDAYRKAKRELLRQRPEAKPGYGAVTTLSATERGALLTATPLGQEVQRFRESPAGRKAAASMRQLSPRKQELLAATPLGSQILADRREGR